MELSDPDAAPIHAVGARHRQGEAARVQQQGGAHLVQVKLGHLLSLFSVGDEKKRFEKRDRELEMLGGCIAS